MGTAPFGLPFILIFLLGAIYFLPLLIGTMYNNDFASSSSFARKTVLFILFANTLFAFGYLLNLSIAEGITTVSRAMFVFITGIVFLIMGPIAGLLNIKTDIDDNSVSTQVFIFLFTLGVLPLFYILLSGKEIFGDLNGVLVFLIILGAFIADVAIIALICFAAIGCKKLLVRTGTNGIFVFVVKLLIPFFASFILVYFNIFGDRLILGGVGVHGMRSVIVIIICYLVTGIIPLRIMMMLAPPVRPANIIIGILSAASMIFVIANR
jgi:hypothetical protein